MRRRPAALLLLALAGLAPGAARAAEALCELDPQAAAPDRIPPCIRSSAPEADICAAIGRFARREGLPEGFLARLIWQESLFDPGAVSHRGAQGIAQFMPGTARLRGLRDPFNPADALAKSAAYLAELARRFGSLGLAAAAYNAGENRVERLLAGAIRRMPAETEDYVAVITGRSIAEWREGRAGSPDFALDAELPFEAACLALARSREIRRELLAAPDWKPWGVQLASHRSRSVARRYFTLLVGRHPALLAGEAPLIVADRSRSRGPRARFALRIGRESRAEALALCRALRARGAACTVARN